MKQYASAEGVKQTSSTRNLLNGKPNLQLNIGSAEIAAAKKQKQITVLDTETHQKFDL